MLDSDEVEALIQAAMPARELSRPAKLGIFFLNDAAGVWTHGGAGMSPPIHFMPVRASRLGLKLTPRPNG